MTVAIIVAHPDDEIFGMGGTIPLLEDVRILILAQDRGSRVPMGVQALNNARTESYRAAEMLGIALPDYPDRYFTDNAFDSHRLLDITREIEYWLLKVKPEVVYTHYAGDLNVDHRLVFQAALTATRPQPGCPVTELYSFEVPSSTEWAFEEQPFQPNVFVDVNTTLDKKLAALNCYKNELRPYPHPRSEKAILARASYWGTVAGLEYAEAFRLIRSMR